MVNNKIRLAITATLLVLLAACIDPVADLGSPIPTPPRERSITSSPELVVGTVAYQYETVAFAAMDSLAAADDECSNKPFVRDTRPDGHSSLSVLPRLAPGDFDELQAFYKFDILDNHGCKAAEPGDWYWDIHSLILECGASNIHPQVEDEDGAPITDRGVLLFLAWPGAPAFSVLVDPPYSAEKWGSHIGVGGFTEGGDLAWAYGGESHIGPDGGPYLVWASSDPPEWNTRLDWSDAIDKLGWWDDHCEPSPIFRLTQKEGAVVSGGYSLVDFDEAGNVTGVILFQDDSPPIGERRLGLRDPNGADIGYAIWQQEE